MFLLWAPLALVHSSIMAYYISVHCPGIYILAPRLENTCFRKGEKLTLIGCKEEVRRNAWHIMGDEAGQAKARKILKALIAKKLWV